MACYKIVYSQQPYSTSIYTNDQSIHYGTRSFIYADELWITAQYQSFKQVEKTIEETLDNLTTYHKVNSLRAIPEKHVTAFHLRNKEAKSSLKVVWNKTELENPTHPTYIQKYPCPVCSRNVTSRGVQQMFWMGVRQMFRTLKCSSVSERW